MSFLHGAPADRDVVPVPAAIRDYFDAALARRGYVPDAAQTRAIGRLEALCADLTAFRAGRSNAFKRLLTAPPPPRGVYLWGGVGRGKSFLMDCFFTVAPARRKTRIHFHEFMHAVHAELVDLKGTEDPLIAAAAHIAKRFRLICFDEFHVSDIADAMILYRLLGALLEHGTVFVMTSNYHPDDLYPDGLHRDRVLPAIALIKERLDVVAVDGPVDYRRQTLEQVEAYIVPLGPASEAKLQAAFERIAEIPDESPRVLIEQRELLALRRAGGIIWFDFATLCGGPRSQNDYLEIASRFHTVLLSGVPRMGAGMSSEARRFTWLVDVLYDHRVKLIMSAEVAPEELYTAGAMANEFVRTASRIREMQSADYLVAERRATIGRF